MLPIRKKNGILFFFLEDWTFRNNSSNTKFGRLISYYILRNHTDRNHLSYNIVQIAKSSLENIWICLMYARFLPNQKIIDMNLNIASRFENKLIELRIK